MSQHNHREHAKDVTNFNRWDKIKISNDYAQYHRRFIKFNQNWKPCGTGT